MLTKMLFAMLVIIGKIIGNNWHSYISLLKNCRNVSPKKVKGDMDKRDSIIDLPSDLSESMTCPNN